MIRPSVAIFIAAFAWVSGAAAQAVQSIPWNAQGKQFHSRSGPVVLECPPGGTPSTVWGTSKYTDDSSICTAAVHAGAITMEDGGRFIIEMGPGLLQYGGVRRNGVTSQPYGAWEGSFTIREYDEPPVYAPPPVAPATALTPPPAGPASISSSRTAAGLGPNGRRFTFVCASPPGAGAVIGTDVYSSNSSICGAARHARAITSGGGRVTIELRPGRSTYAGSTRNGVTSVKGGGTILGFVVVPK